MMRMNKIMKIKIKKFNPCNIFQVFPNNQIRTDNHNKYNLAIKEIKVKRKNKTNKKKHVKNFKDRKFREWP